mgnify:FL=1
MPLCRYLLSWSIDAATAELSDPKRVSLGTQPMILSNLVSKGATHVFAASDRPTVRLRPSSLFFLMAIRRTLGGSR